VSQSAPLKAASASLATAAPLVLQDAAVGSLSHVLHYDVELGRGDILLEVIKAPRPASLLFRGAQLLNR
jgi:hypothetical protein